MENLFKFDFILKNNKKSNWFYEVIAISIIVNQKPIISLS